MNAPNERDWSLLIYLACALLIVAVLAIGGAR